MAAEHEHGAVPVGVDVDPDQRAGAVEQERDRGFAAGAEGAAGVEHHRLATIEAFGADDLVFGEHHERVRPTASQVHSRARCDAGGASFRADTIPLVTKGNLTQKELGWLLAQEAKGAAERVRMSVQFLRSTAMPPPPEPAAEDAPAHHGAEPVEATLDALDDAMRMLGALHQRPPRGRRGRTDLAALLWELAPEARVALEPGAGTEVYGDEEDFRRMLQVLLGGTATNSGAEVSVGRDGDLVAVAVPLGSEGSLVAESERAWLSRMAVRYGGRYEIHGQEAVLSLPADGARERAEREALQRELDEARKQGELYAKELAIALSHRKKDASVPPLGDPHGVGVIAQMARGVAAELRGLVAPLARELGGLSKLGDDEGRAVRARTARVQEFVADLASLGDLELDEEARELDLAQLVAQASEGRTPTDGDMLVRGAPHAAQELLRTLLAFAHNEADQTDAAPALFTTTADSFRLVLDLPRSAPSSLSPLRVFVATRLAAALDWFCEIGPHEGGTRVTLRGPRATPSSSPSVPPPSIK